MNPKVVSAQQRITAANLVLESKKKEHEAACWVGIASHKINARAYVHSAIDSALDAMEDAIEAVREGMGRSQ